jgi:hypothetical protein
MVPWPPSAKPCNVLWSPVTLNGYDNNLEIQSVLIVFLNPFTFTVRVGILITDTPHTNSSTIGAFNTYTSTCRWPTMCMYYYLGPPPAPLTSCSFTRSVGENLSATINWNTSFNSQYNVERYQVAVTPDPTPSCTGSVSPNTSYTCSGLSTDTDYIITVSAMNCRDQEGENDTFSVQPHGLSMLF